MAVNLRLIELGALGNSTTLRRRRQASARVLANDKPKRKKLPAGASKKRFSNSIFGPQMETPFPYFSKAASPPEAIFMARISCRSPKLPRCAYQKQDHPADSEVRHFLRTGMSWSNPHTEAI